MVLLSLDPRAQADSLSLSRVALSRASGYANFFVRKPDFEFKPEVRVVVRKQQSWTKTRGLKSLHICQLEDFLWDKGSRLPRSSAVVELFFVVELKT